MIKMGVYVNDLNLHDSSRELILAGTQQSAELQLALDQVKPPDKERPISKADSCSTGETQFVQNHRQVRSLWWFV